MALTYELTLAIEDNKGKQSSFSLNLPTTFNIADYTQYAVALATIVNAVIVGVIRGSTITIGVDISGLTGNVATTAADIQERASLQYSTAAGRSVEINVGAFDENLVVSGTDDLDLAAPAIAAFDDMMLNGLTVGGATIIPCDDDSEDLTTRQLAQESFVPYTRQ